MNLSPRSLILPAILALSAITGCAHNKGCCGDDCCDKETSVAMADLPPAVRATLEKETAGGKVTEIEKEMKDGKTMYCADATVAGKDWDICIAEDGKLISKEMEKSNEHEKK